jgi:integrase
MAKVPKSLTKSPVRHRTMPIAGSLQKISGFGTLTIYKMEASPFWYVRYYEDGKIIRRSLKVADKKVAIAAAKKLFVDIKHHQMNKLPFTKTSGFEVCARGLLKENAARAARGELSEQKQQLDAARLRSDLMPHFGKYEIADINYAIISDYLNKLSTPARPLSINTLKIHLSHIKTILRYAQRVGVLNALPAFPTLKTIDTPRAWFNSAEYTKLHRTCDANIGKVFKKAGTKGEQRRNITITQELYDLILFMTNSFIRPTDIKVLQHKHIAVIRGEQTYLRLTHPPTKSHGSPVVTMPEAVEIYDRLLERQRKEGFGEPGDYLFQPEHHENRDYALRTITRQFDQLLTIANLKKTASGESRTLYSLRHTCIMFRLTKGDNVALLTLARSARTSTEMIDRFYAKHLHAEMNIQQLQSMRDGAKARKAPKTPDKASSNETSAKKAQKGVGKAAQ